MILLADDNALARAAICRLLQQLGEVVVEASNGDTAVTLVSSLPIDVAIVDFVMPRGGEEVLMRLRGARPALPVVVMSGLPPDHFLHLKLTYFLWKPFAREDLVAALTACRRLGARPSE